MSFFKKDVLSMKFEYIFKYYNKNQYGLAIKTDDYELFTKLQAVINDAIIENEKPDLTDDSPIISKNDSTRK